MGRPARARRSRRDFIAVAAATAVLLALLLFAAPAARRAPGEASGAASPSTDAPPSATLAGGAGAAEAAGGETPGAVRFYLDEGYFMDGETEILRAYISASGGRLAISGESSAAFLSIKGYYVPDKWDVYITMRQVGGLLVVVWLRVAVALLRDERGACVMMQPAEGSAEGCAQGGVAMQLAMHTALVHVLNIKGVCITPQELHKSAAGYSMCCGRLQSST